MSRWLIARTHLAVLFALTTLASCSQPDPPRRAIVIMLDAARADRFSCYGYERETTPNMDRIAERGHVFEKHFANGVNTRTSMPSFLYSRYFVKPVFPYSKSVSLYSPSELFRVLDKEAISFTGALQADGIRTAAISAHHWFHPDTDFAREFQEFVDLPGTAEFDKKYIYPTGDIVVDHALAWLERVGPEEEFLLYLHFMDTHFPHFLEGDAVEYFGASEYESARINEKGEARGEQPISGRDRDYVDAIYDGSLKGVDRELGRLFDALEAAGQLDDTLIAITADHGENLWHHEGRYLHGGAWHDTLGHVPMILSRPSSIPRGRTTAQTQGADFHPTLLAQMGVDLPPGKSVVGLDLFDPELKEREWIYTSRGARSERYKLVFDVEDADVPTLFDGSTQVRLTASMYDLQADPEELADLVLTDARMAFDILQHYRRRMGPHYLRYHRAVADVPPRGSFAISARDLEPSEAIPTVEPGDDVEAALAGSTSGWLRSDEWGNTWLRCRPDAVPMEFRARVPSSGYRISLGLSGGFEVTLDGEAIRAERKALSWATPLLDVGASQVEEQSFRIALRPLAVEAPYSELARVGFQPAGGDASLDGEERTDALRALGYTDG